MFASHVTFNGSPYFLHDLPISPASTLSRCLIDRAAVCPLVPPVYEKASHSAAPSFHLVRDLSSPFADENAQDVAKQLLWLSPLVAPELPYLARGEDSHHPIPVIRLELFRGIDNDETVRTASYVQ